MDCSRPSDKFVSIMIQPYNIGEKSPHYLVSLPSISTRKLNIGKSPTFIPPSALDQTKVQVDPATGPGTGVVTKVLVRLIDSKYSYEVRDTDIENLTAITARNSFIVILLLNFGKNT